MIRALLLVLCLLAALPATAQDSPQPTGTIEVEDDALQDARIANRIRDILEELEGYDDVTVGVSSGIVTLRGTTVDAATANRLNDLVGRVAGVVAIENDVTETTDVVERLNPAVERFRTRFAQFVAFLPLLAVAAGVFALIVFLGFLLARMRYPWDRIAPNAFIADIYRQLVRLVFLVAAIVVALDIIGATALLGTILGAAGIVGLAIGFAVRDTVENFIASIMLSIRQPFRPNDTVEIEGDIGKVIRLTSRATILLSFDGNHIRIPNATVFKSRIINYTRNAERRFQFEIGVDPSTDLAAARALAVTTLESMPFVLPRPAVEVWVETVGDSTFGIAMTGWIDQSVTSFPAARGEAIRLVVAAYDAEGIEMPVPTYRIARAEKTSEDRPPAAPSGPPELADIADVQSDAERALEKIVDAERETTESNDLLSTDGREE